MTYPVALYLQDAHDIRDGIEIVRAAEAKGFDAVWQADREQIGAGEAVQRGFDLRALRAADRQRDGVVARRARLQLVRRAVEQHSPARPARACA